MPCTKPGTEPHPGFTMLRTRPTSATALVLLFLSSLPTLAWAQNPSSNFQVSATIEHGCIVDGLGNSGDAGNIAELDFGTDSALSTTTHVASASTSQSITLRCTPGVDLGMTIDGGEHAQGGSRHLQLGNNSAQRLQYHLYRDASFTQPIGINASLGITITSANMNNVILPIYGRLTLPGTRQTGTYTDTLLVTLTW